MMVQKSLKSKKSWEDVKKIAEEAKDWTKEKWAKATDKIKTIAKKLVEVKTVVMEHLTKWWEALKKSALFKFIVKWSGCIQVIVGVAGAAYQLVQLGMWIGKTIASHGTTLAVDVPMLLVNILCKWPELLEAAKSFKEAWKTKDVLKKFYSYSFFVGKMLSVIIDLVVGRKKHMKNRKHRKLM